MIRLINASSLILSILGSNLVVFYLNFELLTPLVIGKSYKYDTNQIEAKSVFSWFYEISSDTGYSPEPSKFNFLATLTLGMFFGILFHKYVMSKALFKVKKL